MKRLDNSQRDYEEWHRLSLGEDSGNELSSWHINALSLCADLEGLNVLEAGCGTGAFCLELARRRAKLSAFDFSETGVTYARDLLDRHGFGGVDLRVGDLHQPPFEQGVFDLVFCCECLEHVARPGEVLRRLLLLLRPGGRLILTTENYTNGMLVYWLMAVIQGKPFNSGVHPQPIEHFFVFPHVRRMLSRAGFRQGRMVGSHHVFFVVPGLHPHRFVVERFKNPFLKKLCFPFARHVAFEAMRPESSGRRLEG